MAPVTQGCLTSPCNATRGHSSGTWVGRDLARSRRIVSPPGDRKVEMDTAKHYLNFAAVQARDYAPLYDVLCRGVARDPAVIGLLDTLPPIKRQPNLLLAGTRFLGGPIEDYASFRTWVISNWSELSALMLVRRTQTNEAGRCATLLPILAALPQPLTMIEVGASAGLCLYPDRYGYRYDDDGITLGPDAVSVLLECQTFGDVPLPTRVPEVVGRFGVDLNPLDVTNDDDLRWLEMLVWPGQDHRVARLRAAAQVASAEPPTIVVGDLNDKVADLVASAPTGSTPVVFHTAVLVYLSKEERSRFAATVSQLPAHWISNESEFVFPHIAERVSARPAVPEASFLMALDGVPKAYTGPHGQFIHWL